MEALAKNCWYCGAELVRGGKWVQDQQGYGIGMEHIDTRREITRDRPWPDLVGHILACRACRSQRRGKSLEEYRRWLALRTPEGVRWQSIQAALKDPCLPAEERELLLRRADDLEKVVSGYLFYAERLATEFARSISPSSSPGVAD